MNNLRLLALGLTLAVLSLLVAMSIGPRAPVGQAAPTTTTLFSTANGVVQGYGGQFDEPWWNVVRATTLTASATTTTPTSSVFGPDQVTFNSSTDMDQGRQDLVTGQADFAVAEEPLTGPINSATADVIGLNANEQGTATQNGLTVAYVPVAMEAIAVPFIVIPGCSGSPSFADLYPCTLVPTVNMSAATLEKAFTLALNSWNAAPIQQDNEGHGFVTEVGASGGGVYPADPALADASNAAISDYFLTTGAQNDWNIYAGSLGVPANTVVYSWPHKAPTTSGNQFYESDMISDLVPNLGSPFEAAAMSDWAPIYNITAIPWAWTTPTYTGYPVGNLPDISVQNAEGAFVEPSYASMEAAFSYASTCSPTSSTCANPQADCPSSPSGPECFNAPANCPSTTSCGVLVNFGPSGTDTTAYPAQLMTTDYLVVPLNGLPSDKATTLAGFLQYLLSPVGQNAICSAGYLPIVQTGLNSSDCPLTAPSAAASQLSSQIQSADNTVVTELKAEATPATTTTSSTTTSTSTTTTSTTTTSTTTTSTTTTSTTTTSAPAPASTTTAPGVTTTPATTTTPPATTTPMTNAGLTTNTTLASGTPSTTGALTSTAATVPHGAPAASTGLTTTASTVTSTPKSGTTSTTVSSGKTKGSSSTTSPAPSSAHSSTPPAPPTSSPSGTGTNSATSGENTSDAQSTNPVETASASSLAYTGNDVLRFAAPGFALLAIGEVGRRWFVRRRKAAERLEG